MKKSFVFAFVGLAVLGACQKKDSAAEFKVGAMAGPEAELVAIAAKVAAEKSGLAVKVVEFTDYVSPNEALAGKNLDANAFQTVPYLEEFQKNRGAKLAIAGKTFLYPIGVYSKKHKVIADLPQGATVSIPNDPSNEGRALLVLEQAGVVKLKPGIGILGTVNDVIENPKKLTLKTLDAAQLPRALDDVDAAVINTNFAKPAGLTHGKDTIFVEQTSSPYTNIIATREDNAADPRVAQFVAAYQSPQVAEKAKELFGASAVPGFAIP